MFEVILPDGTLVNVRASSKEEAHAIATKYFAEQRAGSQERGGSLSPTPVIGVPNASPIPSDNENFDYETGVALPGLRAALGFAETAEEKEDYLTNKVGSEGFTRDSAGNLAITVKGLKKLGISSKDGKNVIIDESKTTWGDVADFSGIVGPIAGTLVTMTPWGRAAKYGHSFLKEVGLMAAGAGLGKGGEELVESVVDYQRQSPQEIAETAGKEALFMGGAQTVFGAAARGVKALIGPKASVETLDAINDMAKGMPDPKIVAAKEVELGRALTAKELAKIPKIQAIPHQLALGRPIPGRMQSAYETILNPKRRHGKNIAYLEARMQQLMKATGATELDIAKFSTKLNTGTLVKEDIMKLADDFSLTGKQAENEFQKLLIAAIERIDDGIFDKLPKITFDEVAVTLNKVATREGAQDLATVLSGRMGLDKETGEKIFFESKFMEAFKTAKEQFRAEYGAINEMFSLGFQRDAAGNIMKNSAGENLYWRTLEEVVAYYDDLALTTGRALPPWLKPATAETTSVEQRLVGATETTTIPRAGGGIDYVGGQAPQTEPFFLRRPNLQAIAEQEQKLGRALTSNELAQIPEVLTGAGRIPQLAFIPTGQIKSMAQRLSQEVPRGTPQLDAAKGLTQNDVSAIMNLPDYLTFQQFHNFRRGLQGGDELSAFIPGGLSRDWKREFMRVVDDNIATLAETGNAQAAFLTTLPPYLRELYDPSTIAKALTAFKNTNTRFAEHSKTFDDALLNSVRRKVKKGGYDADQLVTAILGKNQPERYRAFMNILPEAEREIVERQVRSQFLTLSVQKAYDPIDNILDPVILKRELQSIGTTAEELMGPYYNPFVNLLDSMNFHGAKMTGEQAGRLMGRWTKDFPKADGVPQSLHIMSRIAKAAEKEAQFGANQLVRAVRDPKFEPERIVKIVFKPQGAKLINDAKQMLAPETFALVQQDAMRTLLKRATGNQGTQVQELFNSSRLQSTMRSYGDETLEAMFGKENLQLLNQFNKEMAIITGVEGQGAGNIVAGAVALYAFNLANIQTVGTIGIIGRLLSSNRVVQALSKTDAGSIRVVMNAMQRAIQLEIAHLLATGQQAAADELQAAIDHVNVPMETQENVINEAGNILEQTKEAVTPIRDTIRQTIGETFGAVGTPPINSAAPTSSPMPLPNVAPPQVATANPIVLPNPQDRFLAERLGRT